MEFRTCVITRSLPARPVVASWARGRFILGSIEVWNAGTIVALLTALTALVGAIASLIAALNAHGKSNLAIAQNEETQKQVNDNTTQIESTVEDVKKIVNGSGGTVTKPLSICGQSVTHGARPLGKL